MEAANSLCRLLLLTAGLAAVLGCQTDASAAKARGQVPQDPLAPIAPPLTPPPNAITPIPPINPNAPIAPLNPILPSNPGVSPGVMPAFGGAVTGSPVPPDAKGPVVTVGAVGTKTLVAAADVLKTGVPRVKVIAIVGANNVITDQEVRESVWQQNRELAKLNGPARAAKEKELYTTALRRMIERELILDDMYAKLKKANKMAMVDDIKAMAVESAEKQLREMKKHSGVKTDDDLNTLLRAEGLTLPVLRRQIERQVMSQQYVSSMLKETGRRAGLAEIRDYYNKHPDEFKTPDRVRWQHLFVSFAKHPTAQAAYNHAEAIRQKAAAGDDFGALSKQFDNGLAGNQGGFGAGEKRGEVLPLDVEPTVWSLKIGQVSGLIETPTGIHIVKVVERDYESVLPFDSKVQTKIRDKMNESLYEINAKRMIEELWRKGVIQVLED